ncbi:MAG TPA: 16S rRNA (cytosine(1402)-N(4))-methyltransferase RsmH [Bryobacteraceae bacterium]|nr:16S rRNA (cytosine(1402)-N(4))-methyltransferase RsmH [Bryobacteraceae bacterium]
MHVPVMLAEALEYLAIKPDGVYLDATCGLGGHTRAIAERLTTGLVLACDRDQESLEIARRNTADVLLEQPARIRFHQAAFSRVGEVLATEKSSQLDKLKVDGLLADLGVSRYQLTEGERGFSLMADGPLDMRMDRSEATTAAEIVNYESEKNLADLIYKLGEERRSRKIARAIVRARPIRTTGHLAKVIEEAVPRTGKLHPATQTFMALRIAVNREEDELDALLGAVPELVKPGGRVVIITFMSLEDRRVKRAFQELERAERVRILTRHVVRPSDEEVAGNAPSRSAKLRAVEVL